ncbi:hypothetical protein [Haloferax mediterranei]|uniref:hypothetical protein n=1 Tax=Haloferax mediterranei TaxID=2252 RepID=UPI001E32EE61|nr:hypothetical protein [Haloferax mediterranei]
MSRVGVHTLVPLGEHCFRVLAVPGQGVVELLGYLRWCGLREGIYRSNICKMLCHHVDRSVSEFTELLGVRVE